MQDWFEPILGPLGAVIAQFVVWTLVVLAVLVIAWWIFRRFSGVTPGSLSRGRVPRLAILDAMALDNKRRLVLIRRDNAEHLLMIGGAADIVVESSIHRPQTRKGQNPTGQEKRSGDTAEGIALKPVDGAGLEMAAIAPAAPVVARAIAPAAEAPPPAPPPPQPAGFDAVMAETAAEPMPAPQQIPDPEPIPEPAQATQPIPDPVPEPRAIPESSAEQVSGPAGQLAEEPQVQPVSAEPVQAQPMPITPAAATEPVSAPSPEQAPAPAPVQTSVAPQEPTASAATETAATPRAEAAAATADQADLPPIDQPVPGYAPEDAEAAPQAAVPPSVTPQADAPGPIPAQAADGDDTNERVSELEREMARLLGEGGRAPTS